MCYTDVWISDGGPRWKHLSNPGRPPRHFLSRRLEACIRDALNKQTETQAVLRPAFPAGSPRASWEPESDSLVVVEIICSIEELLGVPLPASFVPRGGYESIDSCVLDVTKQAEAVWVEATKKENEYA
jgi:hypothetical protein